MKKERKGDWERGAKKERKEKKSRAKEMHERKVGENIISYNRLFMRA